MRYAYAYFSYFEWLYSVPYCLLSCGNHKKSSSQGNKLRRYVPEQRSQEKQDKKIIPKIIGVMEGCFFGMQKGKILKKKNKF